MSTRERNKASVLIIIKSTIKNKIIRYITFWIKLMVGLTYPFCNEGFIVFKWSFEDYISKPKTMLLETSYSKLKKKNCVYSGKWVTPTSGVKIQFYCHLN